MPTGTGKTETMVALMVHERPERLLVVVPSDALRTQISSKFITLGVLKMFGVCGPQTEYPIVGILNQRPNSMKEMQSFFEACNVVVSTMALLGRLQDDEQKVLSALNSHLFIDEAHHIKAETWSRLRDHFVGRSVLQFTATPFRNDGRHVDGRVIFNYPLRRAQDEGYFTRINLVPLFEFDPDEADRVIAESAVERLKIDLQQGHDHLIMARASSIDKAQALHKLYANIAKDFSPVLIHSKLGDEIRKDRISHLRQRQSRVVVCVDMFGEGFDLPELKIAALHSIHKSLAVTLQFMGRFTRTKASIGEATAIVNLADQEVDDSIRELYAEDADWNVILRRLSEKATTEQEAKETFLNEFDSGDGVPVHNITPKMSTVIYKTACKNWKPQRLSDLIDPEDLVGRLAINPKEKIAYFIKRETEQVQWGERKDISNVSYDLYVLHWQAGTNLLFINTSNNDAPHEELAKAVTGDDVILIKGNIVFRALHGLTRVLLQNLGLTHAVSRVIRFTMFVGGDIYSGLADANLANKVKTNVFASGFEGGERVTIGCSRKGRLWSYQIARSLFEWMSWCHDVGSKIADSSISEDDILKNTIVPTDIEERPKLFALAIEWPDSFYARTEDAIHIGFGQSKYSFHEVGLELINPDDSSPIRFRVFTETDSATFEIKYSKTGAEYIPLDQKNVMISVGRKVRTLPEWFHVDPPIVRFENDTFVEDNQLCQPYTSRVVAFDSGRIQAWSWQGVNLKRESQTKAKFPDSIQFHVLQAIQEAGWPLQYDVIFDDDDTNEAADIVGIKINDKDLIIHFFHCKYSGGDDPGARVKDLYEVCGQAERTVQWRANIQKLFTHLQKRETLRLKSKGPSRFEKGSPKELVMIKRQARILKPDVKVFVIQPGLSKSKVTTKQLELLGATDLYLSETYSMRFEIIGSA
jgi:superfamily II DNA or RNA helicase